MINEHNLDGINSVKWEEKTAYCVGIRNKAWSETEYEWWMDDGGSENDNDELTQCIKVDQEKTELQD